MSLSIQNRAGLYGSGRRNRERLNGNNGLLLSPHVDHLFDRGYISFEDNGDVLLSPRIEVSEFSRLGVVVPLNVGAFSAEQYVFLDYHRTTVFLSAA